MKSQQRQTAETFDTYQGSYSNAVNDSIAFTGLTVDFFTKVKAGYIQDLAERHFKDISKLSVLDVGCGIGNYHKIIKSNFGHLAGVDVSEASIMRARADNAGVDYRSYDGSVLPFDDDSFDLAFTICVMHHVPVEAWPNFVAEMRRVIRPGGLALVFEHNPRNPLTMRAVNNCPFDADAVLLRSERTVQLFRDAGFSNLDSRFILSIPAGTKFLRKVDQLASRIPFGAQYYVSAEKR